MKGGISILVHWKYMVGLKIKPRTPATLARSSTTELLWLISMVHIHVATTNTEQSFTKRFYFNLWKNSPIFIVLLLALFIRKPNIEKYDISLNKKEIRSLVSNGHPITLQPPEQQIYSSHWTLCTLINSLAKARYTNSNCGTNRTLVDKFE